MNTNEDFFWQCALGLVLLTGMALYWSGLPTIGFWPTFFIHLGLIVAYFLIIADFGRSSHIEVGVNILILTILASILFPVFHRAYLNAQRHKQKQTLMRPSPKPSPTAKHLPKTPPAFTKPPHLPSRQEH